MANEDFRCGRGLPGREFDMRSRRLIAGLASLVMTAALTPVVAHAAPRAVEPKPVARIAKAVKMSALRTDIWVFSPAMNDRIRVSVLTPAGATSPRSTVYMLDGAGNYKDVSDWITKGRAGRFFADKNVNVVLPAGASGTFYTDWKQRDAKLGKPMWETFLTKELPPLVDERFNGNGRNAIIGLSMGGQAAFALTVRNPAMYTGVASLSGCPPVSGPFNEAYVRSTVGRDGGDATNMWGPFGLRRVACARSEPPSGQTPREEHLHRRGFRCGRSARPAAPDRTRRRVSRRRDGVVVGSRARRLPLFAGVRGDPARRGHPVHRRLPPHRHPHLGLLGTRPGRGVADDRTRSLGPRAVPVLGEPQEDVVLLGVGDRHPNAVTVERSDHHTGVDAGTREVHRRGTQIEPDEVGL